jgi:hypothetical protein
MEERTARESAVAEIGAGGRTSTGGDGELDWGARDPADSNGYTCEPHARRSEGERLGSFTNDEGARVAAMARRSTLQLGDKSGEGTGRRGSLGVCEGGAEVPWGRLYRLEIEGEGGFPAGMSINGRGLEGELRGRGIMEGNGRLKRGNEGRASLRV